MVLMLMLTVFILMTSSLQLGTLGSTVSSKKAAMRPQTGPYLQHLVEINSTSLSISPLYSKIQKTVTRRQLPQPRIITRTGKLKYMLLKVTKKQVKTLVMIVYLSLYARSVISRMLYRRRARTPIFWPTTGAKTGLCRPTYQVISPNYMIK